MKNYSLLPQKKVARPYLFILERNPKVLNYLKRILESEYTLRLFPNPKDLVRGLEAPSKPDILLFAWEGAEASLALLTFLRAAEPGLPVLLLSCSSEMADYEVFVRLGITSVVLKPFVEGQLEATIEKMLPGTLSSKVPETKEIPLGNGLSFVRFSNRMRKIETQANLVARSDIPVLILGESGTGKEILALYIHKMSGRSNHIFLKINCAAMPAELLESELFGYEQGAFTGAMKTKPGKFETCNGGTIFLDEIGEMPAILQAKLLHVLQDGSFSRLGGRIPMKTDVRVIAATNVKMKEAMAQKTFREDLYYRLNGLSILLPPLRERLEEIPVLASYFMSKGAKKYGMEPLTISASMLHAFAQYSWPGNLRELENIINRYLILQDEASVVSELTPFIEPAYPPVSDLGSQEVGGLKSLIRGVKGEAESVAIAKVLNQKGWNRKAAASDLQISYKALLYKIKQYDLAPRSA